MKKLFLLVLLIGFSPNFTHASVNSNLMHAVRINNLALVKSALDAGADVNSADKYGWTALLKATQYGYVEVTSLLLEHGANVNITYKAINTSALHISAIEGHDKVTRLLLEHGADVNAEDTYGMTALSLASRYDHDSVARILIENNADIEKTNKKG